MRFLILLFDMAIGLSLLSVISSPEEIPHTISPPVLRALLLAYDPYDGCVGEWQYVWPRKTPGGRDPEKIGLGADPKKYPYGTRIKLFDPGVCKFIRETDPYDEDGKLCILTVDDTGQAALDDANNHFELRVPRRKNHPDEDAHARALSLGRHDNIEFEIVSSP